MAKSATVPAKKAGTKQEVAASNAANQLPAHMQQDAGKGSENIGNEDIGTPRVKLIQSTSPELTAFNELRAGQFFHVAEEFIFPDNQMRIVPIFFAKKYLLWNPLEAGGGILARADDGKHWSPPNGEFEVKLDKKDGGHKVTWKTAETVNQSGLAEWGSMNPKDPQSPPAATLMYEYVCGFPDFPELSPAVFTFQRSSIRRAKTGLNDKLKLGRAPIFGRQFILEAVDDVNSSGQKFFNIQPKADGYLMDEGLYELYKQLNEAFTASGLRVHGEEDLQTEAAVDDKDVSGGKY